MYWYDYVGISALALCSIFEISRLVAGYRGRDVSIAKSICMIAPGLVVAAALLAWCVVAMATGQL